MRAAPSSTPTACSRADSTWIAPGSTSTASLRPWNSSSASASRRASPPRGPPAADQLTAGGIDAFPVAADLARVDDVARLFAAVDQQWGQIDVLVNNAGTSMIAPSERLSLGDWQRTLDVNLTGAFLCAQEAARRMIPRRRGVIINVSSILGEIGLPQRAAYCATKHGL